MPSVNTPRSQLYAHGLMLLMIILVASSFPVAALITADLPPAVLMWIRFSMAALLFTPLILIRYGLHLPGLKQLASYTLLSIPLVTFFWCMFEALRHTTALNTGALYTLVPAITAVFAGLINRESTDRKRLIGLLTGTAGALWIVFGGEFAALSQLQLNKGDGIFLIGCLFMGAYSPLVRKLYNEEPLEVMTFWVILIGSIWLLLLSLPDIQQIHWPDVSYRAFTGALYLALFTTLITFYLVQFGTLRLGATRVSAYSFLTPVFVMILNQLISPAPFIWSLLPGLLLVSLAMLLIQWEGFTIPRSYDRKDQQLSG